MKRPLGSAAAVVRFFVGGVFVAALAIAGVVASPLVTPLSPPTTSATALPAATVAAAPGNPFDYSAPSRFESAVTGSQTHCGGLNERACTIFERTRHPHACDDYLIEQGPCTLGAACGLSSSMCRALDCGGADQRACTLGEQGAARRPVCDGGLVEAAPCTLGDACKGSSSMCRVLTACGGLGQRACTLAERGGQLSCGPNLIEEAPCTEGYACFGSSGMCRALDCGSVGQRACTIGEQIGAQRAACDVPLAEKGPCTLGAACKGSSGMCRQISECGGDGQRACTFEEQGPLNMSSSCNANMTEVAGCTGDCAGRYIFDSSGVCTVKSACGGLGQRACTPIDGGGACSAGLVEVPGCSGDCLGKDSSVSSGRCTTAMPAGVIEQIPEPLTGATIPGAFCSLTGFADMHMHQFGHLAHGGAVLAGKPTGVRCTPNLTTSDPFDETCVDDGVNTALRPDFTTDLDLVNGDGTPSGNWPNATFQITATDHPLAGAVQGLAAFVAGLVNLFTPCPAYLGGFCQSQDYFHGPHDPLLGDSVGSFIGTKDGADSNYGSPLFNGWPKWTSTTHQQAYYKWLERGWQGGMRLMTQLAVTNEALCRGGKHVNGVDCTDSMASIDAQTKEAYRFQAFIDRRSGGFGKGWYRIVTTPLEAREAIARGKLAVVLGIETAELFNCYDPAAPIYGNPNIAPCDTAFIEQQVDKYYALGIRHIFPIHNFDNAFGAAATWQDSIEVGQRLVEGNWWTTEDCANDGYGFKLGGFTQVVIALLKFSNLVNPGSYPGDFITGRPEQASCNAKALRPIGRDLINKLMAKGMIIDIDHMSNKALDETLTMVEGNRNYPVVASHVLSFDRHVQGIDGKGTRHERLRTSAQLQRIRNVGGMVAAMLKDDAQDTDNKGKKLTLGYDDNVFDVADDCIHSSKTFAHAYQYLVDQMGGPVALGSDFNGVAGHVGPRFGKDACGASPDLLQPQIWQGMRNAQLAARNRVNYPFPLTVNNQTVGMFAQQKTGHRTFDYNYDGLAHVGMLPDFIQDLKLVGMPASDLSALFGSAEAYVKMWERAARLSPATDDDTPQPAIDNTCSFFNLPDGKSPVITVPGDITLDATTFIGRSVSFSVTASDPQEGPLTPTCSHVSNVNYAVGTTTVSCSVRDRDGNTARDSFRITIVDSPPTIDAHADLVFEAQSASGANVTYTLPASYDLQDGTVPVNCAPLSNQTFPRGHTEVTCTAVDKAKHTVLSFFDVYVRDTVAPTVTVSVTGGTPGQAGWYMGPGDVVLSWSWFDAVGVITTTADCSVSQITNDSQRSLTCFATDAAGNRGSGNIVVKLDRTAPVIAFGPPSTAANANGWHNADVQIPYAIADATSGIPPSAPVSGIASFTNEGQGLRSTVTATDVAGNIAAPASPLINLDKTPPTITAARAPLANAFGWNNTDVTVSFDCSDALSGVATCTSSQTITTEGPNQSRAGQVADKAGNEASTSVGGINLDKTPPVVTCSNNAPSLWPANHKMVAVQFGVAVNGGLSGAAGFKLLSATSNEPDNGLGDGDTADDIQSFSFGTADVTGMLRAERSGRGTGRVYSLFYQGADLAGNVTPCTSLVRVAHDQSDKK